MPTSRTLAHLIAVGSLTFTACAGAADPTSPTPVIQPPPSLQDGTWDLRSVDGQLLPAIVANRVVMGVLEQTILDSSRLVIRPNRSYEQRIWTRTLRNGAPYAAGGQVDAGSWAVDADRYRFASATGARSLTVRNPSPTELRVVESLATGGAPDVTIVGAYVPFVRRFDPAQPVIIGQWRARDLAGATLPAAIEQFSDDPSVPGTTEIRLDGAEVQLTDDSRYTLTTRYSEWHTLTPADPASWRVRQRYSFRDFGTYTRTAGTLTLSSAYYQNLVVPGTLGAGAAAMRLTHGLTPGDTPLNIGYERVP